MQMMEGDESRQRRKLLTPMMGRGQLTKIATTVADEIDLQHEINGLVIPAFIRAMFTTELSDVVLHRLDADIHTLMASASSLSLLGPVPRLLPGEGNPAQARQRRGIGQ
jgi:hypothetical protein